MTKMTKMKTENGQCMGLTTATPLITTNGMFIIDDIYVQDGTVHKNIPGGGGMFAMLGGCVVSPTLKVSNCLKWIVDRGRDFPLDVTKTIENWGSGVQFRDDALRGTTRGWNYYKDNDFREFKYLTPKKQIGVRDWYEAFGEDQLQKVKCFHLLCSSSRCLKIMGELQKIGCGSTIFVWEPIPDLCNQEHFEEIKLILAGHHDATIVFSPNAEEGARLFNDDEPLSLEECMQYIWKFDKYMGARNICVLRCGKLGSVALSARDLESGNRTVIHLPAYHSNSPDKVIDPTGGGNSYLGGFCVGFVLTGDLYVASICGNIAAGCIIEQIGVPNFETATRKWNGLTFYERLCQYISMYKLKYVPREIYERLT